MPPRIARDNGRREMCSSLFRDLQEHLQGMQSTLMLLEGEMEQDTLRVESDLPRPVPPTLSAQMDPGSSVRWPSFPGDCTAGHSVCPVPLCNGESAATTFTSVDVDGCQPTVGSKQRQRRIEAVQRGIAASALKGDYPAEEECIVLPKPRVRLVPEDLDREEEQSGALPKRPQNMDLQLAECWVHADVLSEPSAITNSARFQFDVFAKTEFGPSDADDAPSIQDRNLIQVLVMEPSSRTSLVWSVFEMMFLLYDLVMIPMSVFDLPMSFVTNAMLHLALTFWSADIVVSCFKGYVTKDGEVEMKYKTVAKHYFKTRFPYDVALLGIEVLHMTFDQPEYAQWGRFLRILRLLKVGKLRRLIENFLLRIRSNEALTVTSLSWQLVCMLVFLHMAACGWYQVSVMFSDYGSWVLADHITEASVGHRYLHCMQWAFAVLGFGSADILPANGYERGYQVVVSTASLMAFAWLVGSFLILMTRLQTLQKRQREQEEQLRDFLGKHHVSWALRNRVWVFLQKSMRQPKSLVGESDVEMLKHLPKTILLELRSEVFIPVLTTHPFFNTYAVSRADQFAMHRLVETHACNEVFLETEHELFAEGEDAKQMYFVVSGYVTYQAGDGIGIGKGLWSSSGVDQRPLLHTEDLDAAGLCLSKGNWLCEPVLWLRWVHVGSAVAKMQSELVILQAEKFQQTMQDSLPQARRYARRYLNYANIHREVMNDVFVDLSSLRSMAQEVFQPPLRFDIKNCEPIVNSTLGRNEWQPSDRRQWQRIWSSVWSETHLLNRSALLTTMTTDMKHDAILLYNTLFPHQAHKFPWPSKEECRLHDQRVLFLKRLVLLLAFGGLTFTTEENGEAERHWPYPLASCLCHGSRILIRLTGVPWKHVVSWLFHGDAGLWSCEDTTPPAPMYVRRAATHATKFEGSKVSEVKVKPSAAFGNSHLGLDLPIGGLGNPAPGNKEGGLDVGPAGVPYKHAKRGGQPEYMNNLQQGHLYMRWDDFGERKVSHLLSAVTGFCSFSSSRSATLTPDGSRSCSHDHSQNMNALTSTAADTITEGVWRLLPQVRSEVDLRLSLQSIGKHDLAMDPYATNLLLHYLATKEELALEVKHDDMTSARCHGMLMHLQLELETASGDVKVLVHTMARGRSRNRADRPRRRWFDGGIGQRFAPDIDADYRGGTDARGGNDARGMSFAGASIGFVGASAQLVEWSSETARTLYRRRPPVGTSSIMMGNPSARDPQESWTMGASQSQPADKGSMHSMDDTRVITIPIRRTETWAGAMTRYFQETMKLSEAAITRIINGCLEDSEQTLLYECDAPPSYCYRHRVAVGDSLPLHYTALCIRSRIKEDEALFGEMMRSYFMKVDENVPLGGFGEFPERTFGEIQRHWEWRNLADVQEDMVEGMAPPKGQVAVPLRNENKHVSALLVGIEGSAPFKEDCFDNLHTPDGKSKEISAFGKRKWRDYRKGGQDVPADLGGMRMSLTESRFREICEVCRDNIRLSRPSSREETMQASEERELFKKVLVAPGRKVLQILQDSFCFSGGATGTQSLCAGLKP
mmetsp:Transcript_70575/g.204536  ORF Transcript_70575/g.204536 Transcript_70575/m.204536 type:complete len:1547 (-) Transcript_70575:129-4769(-)